MSIKRRLNEYNREKAFEALIALATGVVTLVLIYVFVFWMAWVGAWFTIALHDVRPVWLASGVTGLFFIVALFTAWRNVDPIRYVDLNFSPEEQAKRNLETALGLHVGVPVIRRESIAWSGTILVGPFATMLEALAVWRSRLAATRHVISYAEEVLRQSSNGVPVDSLSEPAVAVLLCRLGLAKLWPGPDCRIMLVATECGRSATREERQ